MIHIQLLGPFAIRLAGGASIPIRRTASQRLVAFLALHPDQHWTREHIAATLWPEADADTGAAALRGALHWLRVDLAAASVADDLILAEGRSKLSWNPNAAAECDVASFAARVETSLDERVPELRQQLDGLRAAADQYRGDLLAGWPDPWLSALRQTMALRYAAVLERLARLEATVGDPAEACRLADSLNIRHPDQESAARLTMQVRFAAGDCAGVEAAYRALCDRLSAAGQMPNATTARLRAWQIGALVHPSLFETIEGIANGIPPLFGRTVELEAGRDAVLNHLSVTLTGPPGVGKSRLAAEIARWVNVAGDGAVTWVDTADVTDRASLAARIAESVRGTTSDDPPHTAGLPEAGRSDLWVLDNVDGCVDAVAAWVSDAPQHERPRRMIVTCREPLAIDGEATLRLAPLSAEMAHAALRHVAGEVEFDPAVGKRIAAAMGFLPLGLVIAGRCLRAGSPAAVLARLDERPDLLSDPSPYAQLRHRNLATALAPSWSRLSNDQRRLLGRLAAADAGMTFADLVAGDAAPDGLAALMDDLRRLTTTALAESDAAGAHMPRFAMLAPIAAYVRARSADEG